MLYSDRGFNEFNISRDYNTTNMMNPMMFYFLVSWPRSTHTHVIVIVAVKSFIFLEISIEWVSWIYFFFFFLNGSTLYIIGEPSYFVMHENQNLWCIYNITTFNIHGRGRSCIVLLVPIEIQNKRIFFKEKGERKKNRHKLTNTF